MIFWYKIYYFTRIFTLNSFVLGISINITLANGMLGIKTIIPGSFKEKTKGLMGNFNGNSNDDYIPRGSNTPLASNSKEEQIFEFGKTCE